VPQTPEFAVGAHPQEGLACGRDLPWDLPQGLQLPARRPVHRSSRRRGLVAQTGVPFKVKKPLSECAVGDTSSHDGAPPRRAVAAQRAMKRGASRGGELLVRVTWWAAAGGARAKRSAG